MLSERQLEKYADVLIWGLKAARTGKFKKGDIVVIRYDYPALRLAEILFSRLLDMGINPVQRMVFTPEMEKAFYDKTNNSQLVFNAPGDKELFENLNGSIFLHAPSSLTHLAKCDPMKIGKAAVARKHLRDILDKREEEGLFGWTLCMLPTDELASHANMSAQEYSKQIEKACFLDKKEPVKEWEKIFKEVIALKKWLNGLKVKEFHVESENVDLIVTPGEKRRWLGISGHNIPSFELFLSPDWRGTKGIYYADQPSYRSGNYVEGVRLKFQKGSVVDIYADKGAEFTKKQLALDKGACRIGEFSLTDRRYSKIDRFMANTLFDENFGGKFGNCHIAVGASYSDTYAGNPKGLTKALKDKLGFNDSALHWDLVNTEKKIVTAHLSDGKKIIIYEAGEFKF